ncbi:multicopper oxidase family protein [Deinococcus sp. NW-56]|uniref:multicopper oxidase family protein n=1 Tax=Deinococcus sp. NW-56 TaxID=2080419 RepID=UPI000CF39322|nr:multicopper oxidase domain-containing protein [Deinococcus sp. NW-56]
MVDPLGHAVPHLHGGHTDAESDGLPGQSFPSGTERSFTYRNDQRGATLWYHDHAMGLTRTNVYAGLAGLYLLRDPSEAAWNLPWADEYDVPLVLQDKAFGKDGGLIYPARWVPEFFGDTAVINGKAFPQMTVEPRRYRFRLLNGSNARFYDLRLQGAPGALQFQQIGSDGGLLPAPVALDHLLLAPGERADVIVDFSGAAGKLLRLTNEAETPYTGLADRRGGTPPLPELMRVRVGRRVSQPDRVTVPTLGLAPAPDLTADQVRVTRHLTLNEDLDPVTGTPRRALLGTLDLGTGAALPRAFHDPITETPRINEVEEWVFINNTADVHPIHLHQLQFMVVDRAPVAYVPGTDAPDRGYPGHLVMEDGRPAFGLPRSPEANERGWKDTVLVYPGEMTRVRLKFDLPGDYVWHCHILEHEENDMMRPLRVLREGEAAPNSSGGQMGH